MSDLAVCRESLQELQYEVEILKKLLIRNKAQHRTLKYFTYLDRIKKSFCRDSIRGCNCDKIADDRKKRHGDLLSRSDRAMQRSIEVLHRNTGTDIVLEAMHCLNDLLEILEVCIFSHRNS
jgi:hypothetical protein